MAREDLNKTNNIESESLAVFRLDYKRVGRVFIQGLFSRPYYFTYRQMT